MSTPQQKKWAEGFVACLFGFGFLVVYVNVTAAAGVFLMVYGAARMRDSR